MTQPQKSQSASDFYQFLVDITERKQQLDTQRDGCQPRARAARPRRPTSSALPAGVCWRTCMLNSRWFHPFHPSAFMDDASSCSLCTGGVRAEARGAAAGAGPGADADWQVSVSVMRDGRMARPILLSGGIPQGSAHSGMPIFQAVAPGSLPHTVARNLSFVPTKHLLFPVQPERVGRVSRFTQTTQVRGGPNGVMTSDTPEFMFH